MSYMGYRDNPTLRHLKDDYFLMETPFVHASSFFAPSWSIYKRDGMNSTCIDSESANGLSMDVSDIQRWAIARIAKLEEEQKGELEMAK